MKKIPFLAPLFLILFFACKQKENKTIANKAAIVAAPKAAASNLPIPALNDTGQVFYKVTATLNDTALLAYEGDFPDVFFMDSTLTIQLPASKHLLEVSHLLSIIFKHPKAGSFPTITHGIESGKGLLTFSQAIDGSIGNVMEQEEGNVTFTKYDGKTVSGTISAKGKDKDGKTLAVSAKFINLKVITP